MKRQLISLTLLLSLALLSACGRPTSPTAQGTPPSLPQGKVSMTCRVVAEEDGFLTLAKVDGSASDVYTLSLGTTPVGYEDPTVTEIEEGALIELHYNGNIQETFPAQLGDVASVLVRAEGFDDLCDLYLDVLEDLWEKDEGLNTKVIQLGLDLSQTSLSPAEKGAVAVVIGSQMGLPVHTGTWEELVEQGYIDREELIWKDGLFLEIKESEAKDGMVTFTAQKWRSGLGAYFFCDCVSTRDQSGHWKDYTIGEEAIS